MDAEDRAARRLRDKQDAARAMDIPDGHPKPWLDKLLNGDKKSRLEAIEDRIEALERKMFAKE